MEMEDKRSYLWPRHYNFGGTGRNETETKLQNRLALQQGDQVL